MYTRIPSLFHTIILRIAVESPESLREAIDVLEKILEGNEAEEIMKNTTKLMDIIEVKLVKAYEALNNLDTNKTKTLVNEIKNMIDELRDLINDLKELVESISESKEKYESEMTAAPPI